MQETVSKMPDRKEFTENRESKWGGLAVVGLLCEGAWSCASDAHARETDIVAAVVSAWIGVWLARCVVRDTEREKVQSQIHPHPRSVRRPCSCVTANAKKLPVRSVVICQGEGVSEHRPSQQ